MSQRKFRRVSLSMTADQHNQLRNTLYPGDSLEAVAILLCGRRDGTAQHRLVVGEIHALEDSDYLDRTEVNAKWSVDSIVPLLESAESEGLSVVKVHSHPGGYDRFSETDDEGDARLLPAIRDWFDRDDLIHGSAVMLPCGRIFGRFIEGNSRELRPFHHVNMVGDDLKFWYSEDNDGDDTPEFAASHAQVFGEGTYARLKKLSVAVVGCSGTGSPVIEQLARLGVGRLVLVDHDVAELRNLNRILNVTLCDAEMERHKVDILAEAIEKMGTGTKVVPIAQNLWSPEAVRAVGECDLVFGCLDNQPDARFLLNQLTTHYLMPYFDLGVRIAAHPDTGEIQEVCGGVHFLIPGGSSLINRGLISMDQVQAASLAQDNPDFYEQQVEEGYISGVAEARPAVITLNMLLASIGVNELLARLHPYREEPNERFRHVQVSLSSVEFICEPTPGPCEVFRGDVGKGDTEPLLGFPKLSERVLVCD